MMERIPPPRKISDDEHTKAEIVRGEKFPDYVVYLRARVRTPEQQEKFESLERRVEELKKRLKEAYPNPNTYSPDMLTDIWQSVEVELIEIAAEAREFADQYRNFNVGASVIGYRDVALGENPWVILFDANTRPQPNVRKHCAELHLMDRMNPEKPEIGLPQEKIQRALALFIAAEPQIDDDSKVSQITLTCCKLCRDKLWKFAQPKDGHENGSIMKPDMPVVSANVRNLGLRKLQQIRDLHKFHGELPPGHMEID